MRFIGEDEPTPILHAYLTSALPEETVNAVAANFESTADDLVRLAIHDNPAYYGQTAEQIRAALDAQSPTADNFILIGNDVAGTEAVEYVAGWVTDEEYDAGMVQRRDEPVAWRMRTMIKSVPSRWIDYSIGNSSIQEDITSVVDTLPWDSSTPTREFGIEEFPPGLPQQEVDPWRPPAYVIAEPGEWEEGPGNLMDVDPPQERVYRLKKEVADQYGLRSEWAIGWWPEERHAAPEGSMCFAQSYL